MTGLKRVVGAGVLFALAMTVGTAASPPRTTRSTNRSIRSWDTGTVRSEALRVRTGATAAGASAIGAKSK